jgi:ABC-type amino acid transport system permease subunit
MPDPAIGSFQLMLSYVLALVVYFLLHSAVKGLFRLLARRSDPDL